MSGPSEQQIHVAIAQFLDVALPAGAWHTALDSSSKSSAVAGAQLKARGGKKGTPDHLVLWHGGVLFLEVKTRKGRASPEQFAVRDALQANGCHWALVRSVEDVETVLRETGWPMRATCGVSGSVWAA